VNAPMVAVRSSSVPRKSERIAARTVQGKAVVIILDAHQIHTLNAVGTRVFELCDGRRSVADIAVEIARHFEVDLSTAERDSLDFLQQLIAQGAVELLEERGRS
jgi:pyrroloquinoline quinone biosynthesis protein D